ncbi:MAG: hypothetical protein RL108_1837 [Bacteroidota bacterium]|jgi:hypothetical protein
MKNIFLLISLLSINSFCGQAQKTENDNKAVNSIDSITETKFKSTEIVCDTIYPNKDYSISLLSFYPMNEDETIPNTLFTISKLTNGKYLPIFSDSIFNSVQEVRFEDFNNDKVKDILVQNYSDVRSNWTYHLYLTDTVKDNFKKIKGFEEIKNPNYLPQYNLIDNYVMSGQIWTSFYKIIGDSIKDFDIVIYDNQTEDGSYERDHKKAIESILRKEKNSH